MSEDLRFERLIDAPPAVVFEAFTTSGRDDKGRTLLTMIQSCLSTAELRDEHARGLPNTFEQQKTAHPRTAHPDR